MRSNLGDIQIAEWLIERLDRDSPDPAATELKIPGGKDDVIHVFYLSRISGQKEIQGLTTSLKAAAPSNEMFYMTKPALLAVRGTADSVALAGRLIAQADNPDLDNRVK